MIFFFSTRLIGLSDQYVSFQRQRISTDEPMSEFMLHEINIGLLIAASVCIVMGLVYEIIWHATKKYKENDSIDNVYINEGGDDIQLANIEKKIATQNFERIELKIDRVNSDLQTVKDNIARIGAWVHNDIVYQIMGDSAK